MTQAASYQGRYFCGAVRFSTEGEPALMARVRVGFNSFRSERTERDDQAR